MEFEFEFKFEHLGTLLVGLAAGFGLGYLFASTNRQELEDRGRQALESVRERVSG